MAFTIIPNIYSPRGTVSMHVYYRWIDTFMSGWGTGSILSSGDGNTVYSSSGSVFVTGSGSPLTSGSIGNPNSWFVVSPPDRSYYLCFQKGVSFNVNANLHFSLTPFNTGSPSATTRPSSSTEISIGPPSANSGIFGTTSPTYLGAIQHAIFGGAEEEYCFAIFNYPVGTNANGATVPFGGMFVDVCSRSFLNEGHASRHVVCPWVSENIGSNNGGVLFQMNSVLITPDANINACAFQVAGSGTMQTVTLAYPAAATDKAFDYGFGWTSSSVDVIAPVWIQANRGMGSAITKGTSRLFKLVSLSMPAVSQSLTGRVGPLCFNPEMTLWYIGSEGQLAVPWDGTTKMRIA